MSLANIESVVAVLPRSHVDTDAIIPKQYLKSIRRSGFGDFLFDDWRYLDPGDLDTPVTTRRKNPNFVLNNPLYAEAKILLAEENFGCGSSREHAVWALRDFGFQAVIAKSFAEIFFSNAFKNNLLLITLPATDIDFLFVYLAEKPSAIMHIALAEQWLRLDDWQVTFAIEAERKERLLHGRDDIGLILEHKEKIQAFEQERKKRFPWL
jgi:3-isopropylmalate/(R)-2-methylmalate dehydratase small subunit